MRSGPLPLTCMHLSSAVHVIKCGWQQQSRTSVLLTSLKWFTGSRELELKRRRVSDRNVVCMSIKCTIFTFKSKYSKSPRRALKLVVGSRLVLRASRVISLTEIACDAQELQPLLAFFVLRVLVDFRLGDDGFAVSGGING